MARERLARPEEYTLFWKEERRTYRCTQLLGHGEHGVVYLAEQIEPKSQGLFALKIGKNPTDPEKFLNTDRTLNVRRMFEMEVEVLQKLRDVEGVARLEFQGFEENKKCLCLVMQHIHLKEDDFLQHCLNRGLSYKIWMMEKICTILEKVHQREVLHLDIKPGNLVIDVHGSPWILDFNISKIYPRGEFPSMVQETLAYMAPEQKKTRTSDKRCDVWAMGAILYELVEGKAPFRNRNKAKAPSFSKSKGWDPELKHICQKALSYKVEKRISSAKELAEKLSQWRFNRSKASVEDIQGWAGIRKKRLFEKAREWAGWPTDPFQNIDKKTADIFSWLTLEEIEQCMKRPDYVFALQWVWQNKIEGQPMLYGQKSPLDEKILEALKKFKEGVQGLIDICEIKGLDSEKKIHYLVYRKPLGETLDAPEKRRPIQISEEREKEALRTLCHCVLKAMDQARELGFPTPSIPKGREIYIHFRGQKMETNILGHEWPYSKTEPGVEEVASFFEQMGHMPEEWERIYRYRNDMHSAQEFLEALDQATREKKDLPDIPIGFHWEKMVVPVSVRDIPEQKEIQLMRCEKEGSSLILIPEGEFILGSEKWKDAQPVRKIFLDAYFIGRFPVTNGQFRKFIEEGGYRTDDFWSPEGLIYRNKQNWEKPEFWEQPPWNKDDHPVVGVSWYEAEAYCNWAGLVLPTEAQWKKAATGGVYLECKMPQANPLPRRPYPWGEKGPNEGNVWRANYNDWVGRESKGTSPVTQFPQGASPYGCLDMAGNVWEWCLDRYDEHFYLTMPEKNPQKSKTSRDIGKVFMDESASVLSGGYWGGDLSLLSIPFRSWDYPFVRNKYQGFRAAGQIETKKQEK